jgi:hypothetical protein
MIKTCTSLRYKYRAPRQLRVDIDRYITYNILDIQHVDASRAVTARKAFSYTATLFLVIGVTIR